MRLKTRRTMRSVRSRRRVGAELLELGLVLGLILLPIMFGTIEFGTYYYIEHNLQAMAREGARTACVLDQADWQDAVTEAIDRIKTSSSINQFNMNIDYDVQLIDDGEKKKYVAVTVSTTWDQVPQGLRPMLMIKNAENHELKGYATMLWEANPLLTQ